VELGADQVVGSFDDDKIRQNRDRNLMKRLLLVVAIIAAVGVAGWLVYTQVLVPRRTEVVDDVMAVAGQQVNAGQLLAELETTDLTLALAQTNAGLEISEAQLAKLLEPPRTEDLLAAQAAIEVAQTGVASAEAALRSAQAAYRELLSGPSEAEQKVNLAQVFQAEANVKTAQQAYNEIKNLSNAGALPQAAELERATIALDVARTQAELLPPRIIFAHCLKAPMNRIFELQRRSSVRAS
jgi:multidrug resistance efflux pump